ncbi:unnamed protein product [Diabrotica balteata]|uniref:Uncharacterized protein n=1 Tax=Diabrotica balteata TaxID=107213 RepID=A0A9N9XA10_DIABA|nr:unnamed protein product [Diabrotica balteata]
MPPGVQPLSVDDCNTCSKIKVELDGLKTSNPNSSRITELDTELKVHLAKQKAAQNMMKSYESNQYENTEVVCIDLQQALPTPKLTCNIQYYKRKMWTYNLGIET